MTSAFIVLIYLLAYSYSVTKAQADYRLATTLLFVLWPFTGYAILLSFKEVLAALAH